MDGKSFIKRSEEEAEPKDKRMSENRIVFTNFTLHFVSFSVIHYWLEMLVKLCQFIVP